MKEEVHLIFRGDVQGVGFRSTAVRLANALRLTGFVRNGPSGDVELVAQGPRDQLEKLENQLLSLFGCSLASKTTQSPGEIYGSFVIKF